MEIMLLLLTSAIVQVSVMVFLVRRTKRAATHTVKE